MLQALQGKNICVQEGNQAVDISLRRSMEMFQLVLSSNILSVIYTLN